MKILHLCLACFYIDGFNYQENILPRIDAKNGHDVFVLASTETYVNNVKLEYVKPSEYMSEDGIRIKRIPYKNFGIAFLNRKLRYYEGLYEEIEKFTPNVIMIHDLSFGSIHEVVEYKKKYPNIYIFSDTHTAKYNSGKNWISLNILHRIIYKHYVRSMLPYLEKYLYVGIEEKEFSVKNYGVPETIMGYMPLGGIVPSEQEYWENRKNKRKELQIKDDELLFVHSGKLTYEKKTECLINAFKNIKNSNCTLVIIGSIPEERELELKSLFDNRRVIYVGWKKNEELKQYLCAADMYCQPGTVSATCQQALCCRCPIMSYPHKEYEDINKRYRAFLWVENENDIERTFKQITNDYLQPYRDAAECCGKEFLDYAENWRKIMPDEYSKCL